MLCASSPQTQKSHKVTEGDVADKDVRLKTLSEAGKRVFRLQEDEQTDSTCLNKLRHPKLCWVLVSTFLFFASLICFAITCLWVQTAAESHKEVIRVHDGIRESYVNVSNWSIDNLLDQLVQQDTNVEKLAIASYMNLPFLAVSALAGAESNGLLDMHRIDGNLDLLWLLQTTLPSLEKEFAWANIPKLENVFYADRMGLYVKYSNVNWNRRFYFRPRDRQASFPKAECRKCPSNATDGMCSRFLVDEASGMPINLDDTYDYDPRQTSWWQRAIDGKGDIVWSDIRRYAYDRNDEAAYGFTVVQAAFPDANVTDGLPSMVVGSALTIDHISQVLDARVTLAAKHRASDNKSIIFIVDERGRMIASSNGLEDVLCRGSLCDDRLWMWNQAKSSLVQSAVKHLLNRYPRGLSDPYPGDLTDVDALGMSVDDDTGFIYSHARLDSGPRDLGLRWIVVRAQPIDSYTQLLKKEMENAMQRRDDAEADLAERLGNQYLVTVILCALFLIVGVIGLSFISWLMSRRLKKIAIEMNKVANFEFDEEDGLPWRSISDISIQNQRRRCYQASMIDEVAKIDGSFENMKKGLQSFSKYMDPHIVQILVQSGKTARLAVAQANVTVFFSDIANFTSMAETLPPDDLAGMLGEYLEEMSDLIMQHSGIVGEFIGDEIMAWWNAPWDLGSRHTLMAMTSALEQQRLLATLRHKWSAMGLGEVHARMGLVCGHVLAGNIGSRSRMKYGLMGDNVNLASRLEQLCKRYGVGILVDGKTCEEEGVRDTFFLRPVDLVTVKGRSEPTELYELVAFKTEHQADPNREFCDNFTAIQELYRRRRFQQALGALDVYLQAWPGDVPSTILKKRCQEFLDFDPGPQWTPVEHLSEK